MPRHKPVRIPKETRNKIDSFLNPDETIGENVNQKVSNAQQDVTSETEENCNDNSYIRKQQIDDDNNKKTNTDNLSGLALDRNIAKSAEQTSIIKKDKQTLHPFVYWAQSQTHITLKVELTQVEDLKVSLKDRQANCNEKLIFSAKGRGAQGLQDYHFEIEFFDKVDAKFDCHKIERHVLILIKKSKQPEKWSRLTKLQIKLPWLRVDFDRYGGDDSDDASEDLNESDSTDARDKDKNFYSSISKKFQESERQQSNLSPNSQQASSSISTSSGGTKKKNTPGIKNFDIFNPFNKLKIGDPKKEEDMKYDYRKNGSTTMVDNGRNSSKQLSYKKVYLFLYNLVMFIMFLKVYIVLIVKFPSGTMDDEVLKSAAFIIKTLTYTQLLETIHPMLGLVPGGPLMPFTQVTGRLLVNIFLTDPVIRKNSAPYAHYLFIVWSSIEIFRYSFYALRVFKVDVYQITWCRYSLFMPLYPMGAFFEIMVLMAAANKFEKTDKYSISMPNSANFSLSAPVCLKIYSFAVLCPTVVHLMRYMWNQRKKQLRVKLD